MLDGVLGVDVADGQGVLRVGSLAFLVGVVLAAALAASGQRTQGQNHCRESKRAINFFIHYLLLCFVLFLSLQAVRAVWLATA